MQPNVPFFGIIEMYYKEHINSLHFSDDWSFLLKASQQLDRTQ